MRFPTLLLAAACVLTPTGAAVGAPVPVAAPTPAPALAATPATVARYTFDAGTPGGTIADLSGRGMPLRPHALDGGAVRFVPHGTGRAVAFPARCAAGTTRCARVILQGGDDVDLDPGTRPFQFGASVLATAAQVGTGANIMQKGVATTASQWKLQIGRRGKAQCVLVGRGSRQIYLVRSSVRVNDGRWHQLVCRRAGTSLTVYVDGAARGTVTVPAALSVTNTLPLRVGGPNLNRARNDRFGGALDDVHAVLG